MLKRYFATFIAVACLATAAHAAPKIGQPAPAFSGTDALSGETISLDALKGKLVVLEWNNPGCPFVKKFYGSNAMQTLQANATKRGVVWVSINSGAEGKQGYYATDAEAKADVAAHKAHPTYYLRDPEGTIGKAYDAKTTPHMFVIDSNGTLAYMGAIDSVPTADPAHIAEAKNYVTQALKALTAGKPVEVTTTKPYGCGVKYKD